MRWSAPAPILAIFLSILPQSYAAVQEAAAPSAPAPAPAFTPPAHPITPEQIRQLVEITHMRSNMQDSLDHNFEAQKKLLPCMPPLFFSEMKKKLGQVDLVAMAQTVYVKYMSEEDASAIIAFYSTPAGQHYLTVSVPMMQEIFETFTRKGYELGQQIAADHKTEIEASMNACEKNRSADTAQPADTPTHP